MKHIDLVAIAVLLVGIPIYSTARQAIRFEVAPYKRIAFYQRISRAIRSDCAFRFIVPSRPFTRR